LILNTCIFQHTCFSVGGIKGAEFFPLVRIMVAEKGKKNQMQKYASLGLWLLGPRRNVLSVCAGGKKLFEVIMIFFFSYTSTTFIWRFFFLAEMCYQTGKKKMIRKVLFGGSTQIMFFFHPLNNHYIHKRPRTPRLIVG